MNRFGKTTECEMKKMVEDAVPENTLKKAKWAMKLFKLWHTSWKTRLDGELKVLKDVEDFTKDDLNFCLKFFYCEMRKVDGETYPPQTQKEICAGIQFYFIHYYNWSFSLFKDEEFKESRKVLDSQMKLAAKKGLVKPKKKARAISFDEENKLWEDGLLGYDNPKKLLNTLIYLFGIHFGLRARQEHRDLEYGQNSQIKLLVDADQKEYLEYTERMSKNKKFGLSCSRMEPKYARLYARDDNLARCPVELYKKYLSHRPEANGQRGNDAFYLAYITNPKTNVWYKSSPLGIHSIQSVTKNLMLQSLHTGDFVSNTSLRRTQQNRLLNGDIRKEIIQKRTGRISEAATAAYIETSEYERRISSVIHNENVGSNQNITIPISSSQPHAPLMISNCENCNITINYVGK
jgi:hypothetical protein